MKYLAYFLMGVLVTAIGFWIYTTIKVGNVEKIGIKLPTKKTNEEMIAELIKNGCVSYYDGCNNCVKGKESSGGACTLMLCPKYAKPKCFKYEK